MSTKNILKTSIVQLKIRGNQLENLLENEESESDKELEYELPDDYVSSSADSRDGDDEDHGDMGGSAGICA